MSILAKKEIMKILKYDRKLRTFSWRIDALSRKAPNKNIQAELRKVSLACYDDANRLTTSCPLKEQIGST